MHFLLEGIMARLTISFTLMIGREHPGRLLCLTGSLHSSVTGWIYGIILVQNTGNLYP